MSQTEQEKLIGEHKTQCSNIFSIWLNYEDKTTTERKKHRELQEVEAKRDNAVQQLSEFIIQHHITDNKLKLFERKKDILDKYEFSDYLEKQKPFPTTDDTKKGNATEILLAEYLSFTSDLDLLIYKLRYNPNVDQSMKGDDVLLLNKEKLNSKVLKGEAKFRGNPRKSAIKSIIKGAQGEKKLPVSISFIATTLENKGEIELSEKLHDLNHELHEQNVPTVNVGLLLSNQNTSSQVEKHIDSDNPDFVMLSLGITDPKSLIDESFELAYRKIEKNESREST